MQSFASSPVGFKEILKSSCQNWWPSLKLIWPLLLILVAIREYYCVACINLHPHSLLGQVIVAVIMILFDLTLWVAICAAVYRSFQMQPMGLWQHLLPMFKHSVWLLIALFFYSFFVSFAGFIGYNLGLLVIHYAAPDNPLLKIIPLLIGFPMIYVVVLLLFTLPWLVIDNLGVWEAFKRSVAITSRHWFKAFFVYLAIVVFLTVLHLIYLLETHLALNNLVAILLDLLSFLVFVPFLANFYVLVMHDLKLRAAA